MSAVINTNIASLNAQRNLESSKMSLNTSIQRLSSGLRINNSQIRGMTVAVRNANDAISFAQTAEGGLAKQTDALQRMRELAVQSANGTNSSGDRANLDAEFQQLTSEVTRLSTATKFNGTSVFGTSNTFQIGSDTTDTLSVSAVTAGSVAASTVSSASAATSAISAIDTALDAINTSRATLGATQNRFESVVSSLNVAIENTTSSKSRIMDADFAAETANMTRGQILQQAGTAMLAQANSLPNSVLKLLQ